MIAETAEISMAQAVGRLHALAAKEAALAARLAHLRENFRAVAEERHLVQRRRAKLEKLIEQAERLPEVIA